MGQANIFVIGLDETNLDTLRRLPNLAEYRIHPLLDKADLQEKATIPIADLIAEAERTLDAFDGSIDAVVGYWDFPVSTIVPILCARYGLRGPSLEAVVKCEHKYWSRLEQRKVIDELPRFALVDLDGDPRPPEGLRFPMWLKPVKSFSSELAFHVADEEEFRKAVAEIREGVSRVGEPFEYILDQLDLPAEIAEAGGQACLAEEALTGVQAAVEGYVYNGEITVYGALDSLNYPGTPVFLRHQYPSRLPEPVLRRFEDVAHRVIGQIGLDNATFSIEFFYDPDTDEVNLLEINPRHSQSHAELFDHVDGVPNHHCMVSLGLGRDPQLPHRKGRYRLAAKWYHRRFEDGVVRRAPTPEEIARVERDVSGVKIDPVAQQGQRLSDLVGQDSYSYELAHIFVGADSEQELQDKYDRCVAALPYEFD